MATTTTLHIWKQLDKLWSVQSQKGEQERKRQQEIVDQKRQRAQQPRLPVDLLQVVNDLFLGGAARGLPLHLPMQVLGNRLDLHPRIVNFHAQPQPAPQQLDNSFQQLLHQTLLNHHPHVEGNGGQTLCALANRNVVPLDTSCTICLCNPTENTDEWTQLPCCRNYLHLLCGKTHFTNDRRCPICRRNVS